MKKTPFQIMVKPVGPTCNLQCDYCFYREKDALYPEVQDFRMTEELLERFIVQYIQAQPGPSVSFAWQGGEPTLLGLPFFQTVIDLQHKHLPSGWTVHNAFQTNGVLLTDEWGAFFREHRFLVGISLDGPADLHDAYRNDRAGQATHERALRGLRLLRKHGVDFNLLCVVNDRNARHPLRVYRFFKEEGVRHLQLIPLVEPVGDGRVSARTVSPDAFGHFLITLFNEWVQKDLGLISVQMFEECLAIWAGLGASLCVLAPRCGTGMVLEHNGDLYCCDHFVQPEFKLGNIQDTPLLDLAAHPLQRMFGQNKQNTLPRSCLDCPVRFICNGGCPKDRFAPAPTGEDTLHFLCAGYKRFFTSIKPCMDDLSKLFRQRVPPSLLRQRAGSILNRLVISDG